MQSKISNAATLCWKSQSLQTVVSFAKINSQRNGSKHYLLNAILTRNCRECSRYLHSSVRNPDLKNVNTFIKVLGLYHAAVHRLHSEFRECSEDSL